MFKRLKKVLALDRAAFETGHINILGTKIVNMSLYFAGEPSFHRQLIQAVYADKGQCLSGLRDQATVELTVYVDWELYVICISSVCRHIGWDMSQLKKNIILFF